MTLSGLLRFLVRLVKRAVSTPASTAPKPGEPLTASHSRQLAGRSKGRTIASRSTSPDKPLKPIPAIVTGTFFHDAAFIRQRCAPGDPVSLRRERRNPHDSNAIAVYAHGVQIGWLKRNLAGRLAPRIDAGASAQGTITSMFAPLDDESPRVSLLITVSAPKR